jgi:TolA-binding protein
MKHRFIVGVVVVMFCFVVLTISGMAEDYTAKIAQLKAEQTQRIEYITKLQTDYQKITQQYTTEIQAQRDKVLELQGSINTLTEISQAETGIVPVE